jgi:tetratricopeptide (TPR) repeat protein
MEETTHQSAEKSGLLEKIAYLVLGITMFLLPFFFVPSQNYSLQAGKGLLVGIGTVVGLAFYIVSLIKAGKLSLPKSLLFLSLILVPVTSLISAFANSTSSTGLLGFGFEVGTVAYLAIAVVLVFLLGELFQNTGRQLTTYKGFFVAFGLIAVFHVVRLLGSADTLSFGLFTNRISNFIGSWNDFGVFLGGISLLSLISLEMLQLSKLYRSLLYVAFVLSLFFLALVNFGAVWVVLAVFALIMFVYIVSFDKFAPNLANTSVTNSVYGGIQGRGYEKKVSYTSLALLVLSLLFVFSGASLGEKISKKFDVASVEVRPSWTATYMVFKDSMKDKALVGSGPNSFNKVWLKYKPAGINETVFWNTDFVYGIGLIPTLVVNTGILGLLSWLLFLVLFIWAGVRAIFYSISDLLSRYLVTSSFMVALYFWVMSCLYVTTMSTFTFAFGFTGLFIASLYREKLLKRADFNLARHPKLSFVSVLVLVALLLASLTLGYTIAQKSMSLATFQKSILAYQKDQNADAAEAMIAEAINSGGYDTFYRGLSELDLVRIDTLLSKPGATPDSVRKEFQQILAKTIESAKKATEVDPSNYQNWISLARVYAALVPQPFAIPGAYENARKTYEQALATNPHSPVILLLLARLEVAHNDLKQAREFVNKAIAEKPNYAEAHFLLAQIEVTEGNLSKAIPSLETTTLLVPNNAGLLFQLGLLKYNDADYNGAGVAFVQAIQAVPDYANAKYFLGLTLLKVGEKGAAIQQFKDLLVTNPNNEELKLIVTNLEAGREPFANAKPPITSKPEKRDKLPLEQSN